MRTRTNLALSLLFALATLSLVHSQSTVNCLPNPYYCATSQAFDGPVTNPIRRYACGACMTGATQSASYTCTLPTASNTATVLCTNPSDSSNFELFLYPNGTFSATCGTGYYASLDQRACVKCYGSCLSCTGSGSSNCLSCPAGQYLSAGQCLACNTTCATCSDTTNTCTSCSGPYYLSGNLCYSQCPSGTFAVAASTGNQCIQCSSGTFFNVDRCVSRCPVGLYANSASQTCSATCASGTYADPVLGTCAATCSAGYLADPSTNKCVVECNLAGGYYENAGSCSMTCSQNTFAAPGGKCVASCPVRYFGDTSTWKCVTACPSGTYANPVSGLCSSACSAGYVVQNGVCVLSCASGTYSSVVSGACVAQCEQYTYADPYLAVCRYTCPHGYFGDPATNKCSAACSAPATGVQQLYANLDTGLCAAECPNGHLTYVTNAGNGQCLLACPDGTYANKGKCASACSSGTYADATTNMCVKGCPAGYYGDSQTGLCSAQCSSQTDYTDSTTGLCKSSCPNGYLMSSYAGFNQCVLKCDSSLYKTDGTCSTSCPDGTFMDTLSQACVAVCPVGYYGDTNTGKCSVTCTNAIEYANPVSNLCTDQCTAGYLKSSVNGVNKCVLECDSGAGYYESQGFCIASCQTGTYLDPASHKCVSVCSGGLYGDPTTNQCVEGCPIGLWGYFNSGVGKCITNCADITEPYFAPYVPIFSSKNTPICYSAMLRDKIAAVQTNLTDDMDKIMIIAIPCAVAMYVLLGMCVTLLFLADIQVKPGKIRLKVAAWTFLCVVLMPVMAIVVFVRGLSSMCKKFAGTNTNVSSGRPAKELIKVDGDKSKNTTPLLQRNSLFK